MAEGTPPRFKLTGTTAGSGQPRASAERELRSPPKSRAASPRRHLRRPTRTAAGRARVPDSSRFRRGDVYTRPVVQGREVREGTWSRLRERVRELATSEGERREQELDRALLEAPRATRTNTIAVVSPKGGVGKTTCTFLVGNLLAEALNLRVVAVDANRDFGTLASLAPDDAARRPHARRPASPPRPHRLGVGRARLRLAAALAACTCSRLRSRPR